ncbi:MAG TPA: hypothetical protein PKY68_05445, partial [Bacteroidales bacterium]|nr:hypothetical protein [Bacteroidales bacterium]
NRTVGRNYGKSFTPSAWTFPAPHAYLVARRGTARVYYPREIGKLESFEQLLKVKEEIKSILEDYSFEHYTVETELDEESSYVSFDKSLYYGHTSISDKNLITFYYCCNSFLHGLS